MVVSLFVDSAFPQRYPQVLWIGLTTIRRFDEPGLTGLREKAFYAESVRRPDGHRGALPRRSHA